MKLTPVGYPRIGGSIYIRKRLNKLSKKRLIDFIVYVVINWHLFKKNKELRLPSQPFRPQLKIIKSERIDMPYNGRRMVSMVDKRRKTKRKFSRKQLAAQRLFAKRSKAGTLRKRRR